MMGMSGTATEPMSGHQMAPKTYIHTSKSTLKDKLGIKGCTVLSWLPFVVRQELFSVTVQMSLIHMLILTVGLGQREQRGWPMSNGPKVHAPVLKQ